MSSVILRLSTLIVMFAAVFFKTTSTTSLNINIKIFTALKRRQSSWVVIKYTLFVFSVLIRVERSMIRTSCFYLVGCIVDLKIKITWSSSNWVWRITYIDSFINVRVFYDSFSKYLFLYSNLTYYSKSGIRQNSSKPYLVILKETHLTKIGSLRIDMI